MHVKREESTTMQHGISHWCLWCYSMRYSLESIEANEGELALKALAYSQEPNMVNSYGRTVPVSIWRVMLFNEPIFNAPLPMILQRRGCSQDTRHCHTEWKTCTLARSRQRHSVCVCHTTHFKICWTCQMKKQYEAPVNKPLST